MGVRMIGAYNPMGPVTVDTTATIVRNALVRVDAGLVKAVTTASAVGLAIAMENFPDADYAEKSLVNLVRLGEDFEVEVPFVGAALIAGDIGAGPFRVLPADGGTVDIDVTIGGVFHPLRLGRDTAIGDTAGYLIGVFLDVASW